MGARGGSLNAGSQRAPGSKGLALERKNNRESRRKSAPDWAPDEGQVREIARAFARKAAPPAWLVRAVPSLIREVRWLRIGETGGPGVPALPGRQDMRDKLGAVADLTAKLIDKLSDPNVQSFIAQADRTDTATAIARLVALPFERRSQAVGELRKLQWLVRRARRSIEPRRGAPSPARSLLAGQPAPPPISARSLTALAVFEVWRALHTRAPGEHLDDALQACEGIWTAAGGDPHGADHGFDRWRRPLSDARLSSATTERWQAFLRSIIAAAERPRD